MSDKQRIQSAKVSQGHDSDPPRCANCCYFRREPHTKFVVRISRMKKPVRVKAKPHPLRNPIVDRCSFGNFEVKPHHICDKWHGRDGTKLEGSGDDGG